MDDLHSSAANLANNLDKLSVTKEQNSCGSSGLDYFHEQTLQAKDVNTDTASDERSGHDGGTSSQCLQKCATFHIVAGAEKAVPVIESENNTNFVGSLSLPAARNKLISAMKGSREKEGLPIKKLSVSWAPDVYDPPPASVSHYPKKMTEQKFRSNKKHGKKKQKGKNVRGGGSGPKDKKQYHKIGCKPSDYGSSLELLDFTAKEGDEISCPESNCGSSYRGNAGNALHFAYAEAT